jgi:hypothetical protein
MTTTATAYHRLGLRVRRDRYDRWRRAHADTYHIHMLSFAEWLYRAVDTGPDDRWPLTLRDDHGEVIGTVAEDGAIRPAPGIGIEISRPRSGTTTAK